jgi:peptidoglycan/LPS O-acetylase OafA/YrhL
MVMAVHFIGDATPVTFLERVAVKAGNQGVLGVDLFFVLSGFLITGILLDAKGNEHYFRNFYMRRILRIFPVYFFVLAVLLILLPLLTPLPEALEQAREHQIWLWTYTTNFFLAARESWALTYLSHFWSLAIEEQFYLVWPVIVLCLRRSSLEKACTGLIAVALLSRIALSLLGAGEIALFVLTLVRLDALGVGALLATIIRREGGPSFLASKGAPAAVLFGGAAVGVMTFHVTIGSGLALLPIIVATLYVLCFGGLLLTSLPDNPSRITARLLEIRWLGLLGKYSYGLYIYHGIIASYMIDIGLQGRLAEATGSNTIAIALQALAGATLSIAVSVLSYKRLEKSFLRLKRYFYAESTTSSYLKTEGVLAS